jgi:hypothetical protein
MAADRNSTTPWMVWRLTYCATRSCKANRGRGPFRVVYDLPANLLYRVDEAGKKVVILAVRYVP